MSATRSRHLRAERPPRASRYRGHRRPTLTTCGRARGGKADEVVLAGAAVAARAHRSSAIGYATGGDGPTERARAVCFGRERTGCRVPRVDTEPARRGRGAGAGPRAVARPAAAGRTPRGPAATASRPAGRRRARRPLPAGRRRPPRWQCCKLDGYRGASRFTTWAYKFVVLEISVKLHRHAWRGRSIPTADDDPAWDRLAQDAEQAEARLESLDLMRALRTAVAEELTPRQREAFVAVVLNEVPADVLAERLGSTRGAIYKTVHDACRKLFAAVVAGERPAEAAIATLNRFSSQAPAALQLDWPPTGQPRSPSSRPLRSRCRRAGRARPRRYPRARRAGSRAAPDLPCPRLRAVSRQAAPAARVVLRGLRQPPPGSPPLLPPPLTTWSRASSSGRKTAGPAATKRLPALVSWIPRPGPHT